MRNKHNTKAFTLLEVIIVIIIVGVLASLALPRFLSMIESSRSVEALQFLKVWRQAVNRCYIQTRDYTQCSKFIDLDIENPTKAPGSHFTRGGTIFGTQGGFMISVLRNTLDLSITDPGGPYACPGFFTGSTAKSTVALCVNNITGKIDVVGSGFYKGL